MIIKPIAVKKNVKKKSSQGKPYTCHLVKYTDKNGKEKVKQIMANSPFVAHLDKLKPNVDINIKCEQNSKGFWDWVEIFTGGGGNYKSNKSNAYEIGMRVGNLTTNAVTLFSSGKAETMEDAMAKVIELQDKITEALTNPTTEVKDTEEDTTETEDKAESDFIDDDFSDLDDDWV